MAASRETVDGIRYGRLARVWDQSATSSAGLDVNYGAFASYGAAQLVSDVKWLDRLVRAEKHPGPVDNVEVHGKLVAYLLELGKSTNNPEWYREALAVGKICTSSSHDVGQLTTLLTNMLCLHLLNMTGGMLTMLKEMNEGLLRWFGSVEWVACLGEEGMMMLTKCLRLHGIDFQSALMLKCSICRVQGFKGICVITSEVLIVQLREVCLGINLLRIYLSHF